MRDTLAGGRWAAILLGVTLVAPAAAQTRQPPPPPGQPKDFVIPKVQRFTLPNGLAVTMAPFGQVPKVTVRLVVQAANLHERKDQVWLANLTGEMLREGTASTTADALARQFAGMGGALDVAVGPDKAALTTDVLAESGPQAVRLIADVAQRPRLPETELSRVKANLARDLAIRRSTPQAIAGEKFAELLYGDHPYGRIFPSEAMLNGYTIGDVRAFHRDHFGAGRARLYVAGVFEPAAIEAAIREAFGGWARGSTAQAPAPAAPGAPRFALLDRPDAPQSTVYLGLRVPDPSQPEWLALEVTDALLGGAFASRITANIREQKGYTYSPYSELTPHPGGAQWLEIADVTTSVTGASVKEIFAEIARLRAESPSPDELRGIQNLLAGLFVVQNASRAGVIGRLAFVDLYGLGDDYLSRYVVRVLGVRPDDVRRMASQYLVPEKMTLVVVGDSKTVKDQLAPWRRAE